MRKLFLLSAVIAMIAPSVFAQNINRCATTEVMQQLFLDDPTYKARLQEIENQVQSYIAAHPEDTRDVVTIPVVVHVVYKTTAQNISDAQVQSQIDVLNQDYRRLNSDANLTRSFFQGVAADCEVNFCLASRDPSGNATNGITRTSTTVTSFSSNNNVKFTSKGGHDAWDRNSYLNIWCANLSGGLLGYAQFPGGPANTDGVVILTTAFGNIGNLLAQYNKGRSATHEVGHWLNLFHIWGDDGTSCNGSDQVSDTPNQADETYNCPLPTIRISCTNGPNGDMYENYMDYTDDACMNMFTAGQKARMVATLAVGGSRGSLRNSLGCVPPNGTCNVPSGLNATSITTSSATLNWSSAAGATSYNIQYRQTGTTTFTTTTSTTTSKAITGLTASTQYEFQVQSDCGGGTTSAFSSLTSFTTSTPTCTDNFENNNTKAKAKAIAVNTDITAKIASSTDKDWFSFTNTVSEPNIHVTLTNLPADYDLWFYNPAGTKIDASENAFTEDESIILNTSTVGTYKVQVFGAGGAFNANSCYTLNASIGSSPFRTTGIVANEKVSGNLTNIYPNPSNGNMVVEYNSSAQTSVQLVAYDLMGRIVFQQQSLATEGMNAYSVSINDLAPGVYVFEILNGTEVSHMKFSVQR